MDGTGVAYQDTDSDQGSRVTGIGTGAVNTDDAPWTGHAQTNHFNTTKCSKSFRPQKSKKNVLTSPTLYTSFAD